MNIPADILLYVADLKAMARSMGRATHSATRAGPRRLDAIELRYNRHNAKACRRQAAALLIAAHRGLAGDLARREANALCQANPLPFSK